MKTVFAVAALIAASAVVPAAAVTYDANASFSNTANPSGQFTFGSYAGGTFTAFPTGGMCLFSDTICLTSGNYLGVYQSADGQYHDSGTANIPASGLVLHPGQNGELSVIQFTAPTTGNYFVKASAYQADDLPQTQTVGYILGGTPNVTATLTPASPSFASAGSVFLSAGQTLSIFVGNDGSYFNDATGVSFSATIPEPATWGLMIAGFAMTGFAMRRRTLGTLHG